MNEPVRLRIGELLVRARAIDEVQLNTALKEQVRWGGKLGEILIRMGAITEDILVRALSRQLGISMVDLEEVAAIPKDVLAWIPASIARDCSVIPMAVGKGGKSLIVAMSDPQNLRLLDELPRLVRGARIIPQLAGSAAIARAIARHYEGEAPKSETTNSSFKMVDAQGRTIIKSVDEIEEESGAKGERQAAVPNEPLIASVSVPAAAPALAPAAAVMDPLNRLEEQQQRSVNALRALVELLIDKGIFTREEYLARIRR